MFSPCLLSNMEDDFFANANYNKNIECMMPTSELMVNFRTNGVHIRKPCFIYTEKLDAKGLIQLRIVEKTDQRRMFISTVDSTSFQEIKQDQSLHVAFNGFIENLIHILQDCQLGKLEICLLNCSGGQDGRFNEASHISAGSTSAEYQLQFVEIRPFKNLIHLSLPCRLASSNIVMFYMNNILDVLQKKCSSQEQTIQQLQREISNNVRRIDQLNAETVKLRESHLDTIKNINQNHADEILQLQENSRKNAEQRQFDAERQRKAVATLQSQIDKLVAEKSSLQVDITHERKANENLNEELTACRGRMVNLKELNERQHAEIITIKNQERKNEVYLQDTRKELQDLKDRLRKCDKNNAELSAELEAEKKISLTKRQALEMATEEISKANEIILKQSQELIKLKKMISWRTEIALQQEQAIKQKDLELKEKNEHVAFLTETIDALRSEIPKELDSMRKFAASLEMKYNEEINALKSRLQLPSDKENTPCNIHNPKDSKR